MGDVPKYYWDACIWIELINRGYPDRADSAAYLLELAERGEVEIWTSAFTLAEVWKRKCNGSKVGIQRQQDQNFEDYIEREHIKIIQVDFDVGTVARRLLRQFPKLGKPQDAIHVASCLLENLDEMHTYDRDDLLFLDGKIPRSDHKFLKICNLPKIPISSQGSLLSEEQ